jgi:UDP-N-acetylglucosamine--N-acetylmuramyl-(pentapeptide) pyrophosphoryl-undecaprenol N-acetylglucosamine transferase
MAYAVADVVISRAGAMSVAEICVAAKPAVFVPYPFAAEDHQTSNAMALVKKDAALMIRDENVANDLCTVLLRLVDNKEQQEKMTKELKALAIRNADEQIAQYLIDLANNRTI